MRLSLRIIFFLGIISAFSQSCTRTEDEPDYRQPMRDLVQRISQKAKTGHPGFLIIPQNGLELLNDNADTTASADIAYLSSIDGVGQEELFYGYENNDDLITPDAEHHSMLSWCRYARNHGKKVLVTDYCYSSGFVNDSYVSNNAEHFISYAASHRDLDNIASDIPYGMNNTNIDSLSLARNFLYLIDPSLYDTKAAMINAIAATNFDMVIIDISFNDEMLTATDIQQLKLKANGGRRKVLCYFSIGEAEDYRYYWKNSWNAEQPSFIVSADPDWVNNYYVKYWDPEWQSIVYEGDDSYLNRILSAGFDGAYLDLVNAYEVFEK